MKKLLLCLSMFVAVSASFAQLTDIELETVVVHPSTDYPDGVNLDGYTTYRIWAVLTNTDDFVSAVFGLESDVTQINTTTDFWNSEFGGLTAENISQDVITLVPTLEYDSYVTVGKVFAQSPGQPIFTAGSDWAQQLEPGGGAPGTSFSLEGSVGGSWFTVNLGQAESENGYAGDDFKVLLGQFTTTGVITGCINVQVFVNGVGSNAVNTEICIGGVFGCTDTTADNYNPDAEIDDGSCLYPCMLEFADVIATGPTCQGYTDGSIQVTMDGVQVAASYQLNDGPMIGVGSFNNLADGTYTITVQDEVCEVSTEVDLVSAGLSMDVGVTGSIVCNGDMNAEITGTFIGGTNPMFDLDPGFTNPQDNPNFTGLGAGSYTVYGMDDEGCMIEAGPFTITQPTVLNVSVSNSAPASCSYTSDGVIVVSATGGVGDKDFSLDGVDYQESNVINAPGGDYTIYIIDEAGCVKTVDFTLAAPDELVLGATVTGVTCNGDCDGSIITTVSGGNGQYGFWLEGGVQDPFGDYMDLCPDDYTVYVDDAEGCLDTMVFTVMEPDVVGLDLMVTDISCFGESDGMIDAMGTGGTPEFEYSIDGVNFTSDGMFGDLDADTYDFIVIDANGCEGSGSAEITEPAELTVTVDSSTPDDGSGSGGSIDITAEGGTMDYTYEWTGPDGYTSNEEDISGLAPGAYSVTVTDANGCTVSEENVIVDTGIGELESNVTFNVAPNPSIGQFSLNIQGLSGQKTAYSIFDASGRMVAGEELNVTSGAYTHIVDITDASNGVYYLTLTVGQAQRTVKIVKQR